MAFFNRAKKKTPVIRTDAINMNPQVKYQDLDYRMQSDEQDYSLLTNQYKHNAIAHKVVSKPAEDATRNGVKIIIPSDPDKQTAYQLAFDHLNAIGALCQQEIYKYMHGDGYITVGVKEYNPTTPDTPLNPQNIQDIAFIHAFGQNHIDKYRTNDDPTSEDYGKEQAIVLRPTESGYSIDKNGLQIPNKVNIKPVVIDKSRYFHVSLDKFEDDLTGTSILTRCKDQLKAMDIALETSGKMLREFTFKAFKSAHMMQEGDAEFERDKARTDVAINTEGIVYMNPDDTIEKVATPASGIDTLFSFAWQQLSAACNIPKSVLTGEQSGTLAGAGQDVVNYYDNIKSMQEQDLKPEVEQIVKLMMWADNIAGGSEDPDSIDWHIEFNPLWSADDKTKSETDVNKMNVASTGVTSGVWDTDQANQYLNGQGNNTASDLQNSTVQDSADVPTEQDIKQYLKDSKVAKSHAKKA